MGGHVMGDLDRLLLRRLVERLLAPWRRTDGPGVTLGVVLGHELVVHESAGMASLEFGVPIGPHDDIPHRLGQQAVHLRRDPVAGRRRQAVDRGRCPRPYPVAAGPWPSHHARAPDAQHLRHPRHAGDHAARRRRSRPAMRAGGSAGRRLPAARAEFRARFPLSLQQLQLHAAGPHRGAGQRRVAARVPGPAHLRPSRHERDASRRTDRPRWCRTWRPATSPRRRRLDADAAQFSAARRRRTGVVGRRPGAVARELRLAAGRGYRAGERARPR